MKRMLSLALVLVLALSLMPFALADETETDTPTYNFTHNSENCEGTVTLGSVTQPTCTEAGLANGTCDSCGAVKATIPATGHDFNSTTGQCQNGSCNVMRDGNVVVGNVTVGVGSTASISVTSDYADGMNVTYGATVDATVATVTEGGTVTGLKKGTTTCEVTVTGTFATETLTCTITVTDELSASAPAYINISTSSPSGYSVGATLAGKPSGSTHNYNEVITYAVTSGNCIAVNASTGAITVSGTGVATITTTISYTGTDGVAATKTAVTEISVYADSDVTVTMASGRTGFAFSEYEAIDQNTYNSLATQLLRTANAGVNNACHIYFTTYATTDGKLTMAGGTGNLRSSTIGMLGDVRFTPLNDEGGSFITSYRIQDATVSNGNSGRIYAEGTLTIKFGKNAGVIEYSTTNSKNVNFTVSDFKSYWLAAGYTGTPSYVIFDGQPYYGDLYTATTLKTKSTNLNKYYFSATGSNLSLAYATYVPSKLSVSYKDEIDFAIYGGTADADVVYGTIVIKVGANVSFTDVKTSDWFYDSVIWAVNEGITKGATSTTFEPNSNCDRSQVVTFLWRAAGEPKPTTSYMPFTDVNKDDFYYDAVLWAVENGITEGTSKTTFSPNMTVTRGQVVTFLWRAMGEKTVSSVNPFTDIKSSEYYYDAVLWAVKNEITEGMGNGKFLPDTGCTRAQIVTFLYRAYN